uniref:Adenylosuccinate synthetase n=1 Tax=Timema poppense TaxID=170557 RepID=A0A7R9DKS8_TIMPO|nr:unnamed protein product [Timema poppensis]
MVRNTSCEAMVGKLDTRDNTRNILAFSSGSTSMGYFGLPIAMALFDEDSVSVYVVCYIGMALFENSLGFYIAANALFFSPEDYKQGEIVRIMYIHVPSAWLALGIYGLIASLSFISLVWNNSIASVLAHAAAPAGTVFSAICLITGAQGTFLDIDHGTYPFVTSSNTVASQAITGSGLASNAYIIGVVKAYTTRVGNGPFPTEQKNEIGDSLFTIGKELGTVSNRRRRCGWFDAVLVRQAVQLSGVSSIVLTKLDVLDSFDTIKICTGYKYSGKMYDYLPASHSIQEELEPIYEEFPGWKENTQVSSA